MSIYVVIASYNGAPWMRECLDSLRQQGPDVTTVVVDNASTDNTVRIVESGYPEVKVVRMPQNAGFGVANNVGISLAARHGAEYILLLNQDAFLLDGALQAMREFMDEHREFGVCSPLHCSPDADHVDPRTYDNYLVRRAPKFLQDAAVGRQAEHYEIFGVNAAIWFVRTESLVAVGGFDPIFFMYGEDDDLLARLAYHQVKFALVPGIRSVHLRQSAGAKPAGLWATLKRQSVRKQAQLISFTKNPNNSLYRSVAMLLNRGVFRPLADLVLDRQIMPVLASLVASAKVLLMLGTVLSRQHLCRRRGPHFLEIETTKFDA